VSDTEDKRAEAALEGVTFAFRQSIEDSMRGLRYPLRRLSIVGLTERDAKELTELGQIVIQEGDVGEVAERIRARPGASPLAVTIASLVEGFANRQDAKEARELMLGALFGAYAGLGTRQMMDAVLGAIGGALAVTTYPVVQERLKERSLSWREWSELG